MNPIQLELPAKLLEKVELLAQKDNIPVDTLITLILTQGITAWEEAATLEARARRGSRSTFEAALAKIPDVEPEERDRL